MKGKPTGLSYDYIPNNIIKEALLRGELTFIGKNYRGNGNMYFRINELENVVLMRVNCIRYISINEWVKYNGNKIYLVPILERISFCNDAIRAGREMTRTTIKVEGDEKTKKKSIDRIIYSITAKGKIEILPTDYHIHHILSVSDSRVTSHQYLHKSQHTDRKSRLKGHYIDNWISWRKYKKYLYETNP